MIVAILNQLDDEVDVVITGHTHNAYNSRIDNKIVTGAASFGRLVTDIDLTIDRGTGEVTSAQAGNVIVTRDVPRDEEMTALVEKYNALSAPFANRVIGTITADITRTANAAGESALGDVIAGAQIDTLLEQQWLGQPSPRILQVSNGFTYSWNASAPDGSKVDPATIRINGSPIDLNATYRVTVNSFLADGGDNFFVLKEGTDRLGGAIDLDALVDYFAANSPVTPGPQNRITMVP